MKIIKKILKYLLILIMIVVIGFIGLIVYAVLTDYKPKEEEPITVSGKSSILKDTLDITLLTWNIGYAGLDDEMDFFFDGGTKVITPEKKCLANLKGIGNFLKSNDSIDFIFLQEIDRGSKRSYYQEEYDTIINILKSHSPFFAKNYDVFFVPKPFTNPMGKVLSGIATFSKYVPSTSTRFAFPGDFGFPTQLFWLDRCFLVNRYPLLNGKEFVLINTHCEAFDAGDIRKAQMEYLKVFIMNEYSKGNYVVAGGDWNQSPPDFKPAFPGNKVLTSQMGMQADYLPSGWKWVYDNTTPSNRSVVTAYEPAKTETTVIDFFLLSPNVESISVKGMQLNFKYSDHNPVIAHLKLK
jgi:endonuclease/exonuclease/phosphatase family metal-dependent hydrolase